MPLYLEKIRNLLDIIQCVSKNCLDIFNSKYIITRDVQLNTWQLNTGKEKMVKKKKKHP